MTPEQKRAIFEKTTALLYSLSLKRYNNNHAYYSGCMGAIATQMATLLPDEDFNHIINMLLDITNRLVIENGS